MNRQEKTQSESKSEYEKRLLVIIDELSGVLRKIQNSQGASMGEINNVLRDL